MNNEWSEAARNYSLMTETDRLNYWNRLNPEQKHLLEMALHERAAQSQPTTAPQRRGCVRYIVIGFAGIVFGVVFTIAAEIILIKEGIDVVTSPSIGGQLYDPPPVGCRDIRKGTSFGQLPERCQEWILRHNQ